MKIVDKLDVFMNGKLVGTMASYRKYLTAFSYSDEWRREGCLWIGY